MLKKYRNLIMASIMGLILLIFIGVLTTNTGKNSRGLRFGEPVGENKGNYSDIAFSEAKDSGLNISYSSTAPTNKAESQVDHSDVSKSFAKRKIILSGNMVIETNKFDVAVKSISVKVQSMGGYVEGSEITGVKSENGNYIENRTASYKIRVPSNKFESFMNQIGTIGIVTTKNSSGEDVTSQYIDSAARLKSQKVKEARLIDILKKATKLTDVLAIETEIENTRYEIENLTSSLKQWDNLVSYSTLTVMLKEVTESKVLVKKPVTLSAKLSNAFKSSIGLLIDMSKGLLIAIVAILPFAVILAVLFAIVLIIIKLTKSRNRQE